MALAPVIAVQAAALLNTAVPEHVPECLDQQNYSCQTSDQHSPLLSISSRRAITAITLGHYAP
ncbi:MAG: hypothetical protein C0509_02165 [Acinetobacter sp.]|nr:hypothetical protein [Acinetobacter sp.]